MNTLQKWIYTGFATLALVSFFYMAHLGRLAFFTSQYSREEAKQEDQAQAREMAQRLERTLQQVTQQVDEIAVDLGGDAVEERLRVLLAQHRELASVGVVSVSSQSQSDPDVLHLHRVGSRVEPIEAQPPERYAPLLQEKAGWREPYLGAFPEAAIGYGARFERASADGPPGPVAGLVFVTFSPRSLRHLVSQLTPAGASYQVLVSRRGAILLHPIQAYLGTRLHDVSVRDQVMRIIDPSLAAPSTQTVHNLWTGKTSWVFLEPFPSLPLTIGTVVVANERLNDPRAERRLRIRFALSVLAFLFGYSGILFRTHRGALRNFWATSMSFSVLCLIGIATVWSLELQAPSNDTTGRTIIRDRAGLSVLLNRLTPVAGEGQDGLAEVAPIRVPTGVFVQSLKFLSANNVALTGYVWQTDPRPDGAPADSDVLGVVFPEAEEMTLELAFQDEKVRGWYFHGTLRQPFNYGKYPFDREVVWIRMWPKAFHKRILLTPDLESYPLLNAAFKPGVEQPFVLEGWRLENSFFSYHYHTYNATFGLETLSRKQEFPELYFNIDLKRNFLGPFISDVIPLIIVSLLLFIVLTTMTHRREDVEAYGFNASNVLAYCSGLFFALIISHVFLREKLAAQSVIYLEALYFIMYFMILIISVNSILFSSHRLRFLFHIRDNSFVRLLYWPLILGVFMLVTLIEFY